MSGAAGAAASSSSSSSSSRVHVVVVGGGLVGSLLALSLGQRGYRVDVYEQRADPRVHGFAGGRSINLALSERGLTALEQVGLRDAVLKDAVPMRGRCVHGSGKVQSGTTATAFQAYSSSADDYINSISRGGLNVTLLKHAGALPNVSLFFEHRCTHLDHVSGAATFACGDRVVEVPSCDLLIGCDGAFSVVRGFVQRSGERFDFSQSYLEHGYKELVIPPTPDGQFALRHDALHIWPRGSAMMIALPNTDRTFTCTLFWPFRGRADRNEQISFEALPADTSSDEEIMSFFEQHFGDAVPLMPTLLDDYRRNPVSALCTMRCQPWHTVSGKVVLLGDAAHAIVPFFGQGMNAGFEDVRILVEMLEASGVHDTGADRAAVVSQVVSMFSKERKPNADAIADMAIYNFLEMRDHVASPTFRLKKKLQHVLHRMHLYEPLYNMVSFSNVPYAAARDIAKRQDRRIALAAKLIGAGAVFAVAVLAASKALVALDALGCTVDERK